MNETQEFDYQWANLPSTYIEYSPERVREFLNFTKIPSDWFRGKKCLDAGCGNGRYSYAMKELGANVDAFDISEEGVKKCRKIIPWCYKESILNLTPNSYDFVLSWGVLHHLEYPQDGFDILTEQVRRGGMLHIMVYSKKTQGVYMDLRKEFKSLDLEGKIALCKRLAKGGDIHGWWDALNPEFNRSFDVEEVINWFSAFKNVRVITQENININGVKV
jgi:2-polyprenyl-3-methyl-5-hydroxy-6-metoxy-1,4-benzoquinol methylase